MRRRLVGAGALAPALVLAARALPNSWLATSDYSFIELQSRAVGTGHTPLVGPYSRYGWNHPGPALFFLLAGPYRLLGEHGHGLLLGAALITAVTTITVVLTLTQIDQRPIVGALGLLVFAVLVRALGAGFLWDPWNPFIIVLPFLALTVLVWWTATGEDRALPFAVGVASFIAQTHVALALEAIALLGVAIGWLVFRARDPAARRQVPIVPLRRSAHASLGVLAVMWVLPIYQQFRPGGGNLGQLWRFWTTGHHGTVGFSEGGRLLALQLSIPAPWMTGHEHVLPFSATLATPHAPVPYAFIVLVVATFVAWRQRDRVAVTACSIAITSTIVAWISIASIIGSPYSYLQRWTWVVAAMCWLASGVALLPPIARRFGSTGERWLARACATGAAVLLVVVTVGAWTAHAPSNTDSRVAQVLANEAVPRLRRLPQPILIEINQSDYQAGAVLGGVVTAAIEHGVDARYEPATSYRAGPGRVISERRAKTLAFIAVDDAVAIYARNPAYHEIASYDTLTASERAEYDRLIAARVRVVKQRSKALFEAYIKTHTADIRRLEVLDNRQYAAAVFVPS